MTTLADKFPGSNSQEDYAPGEPAIDMFVAHLKENSDAVIAETLLWIAEWHEGRRGWQTAAVIRDAARRLAP